MLAEREGENCHQDDKFVNMPVGRTEITGLLKAWGDGDRAALELLTAKVYDELRRIARRFFAISAQMMRRILVDSARARGTDKRGGGAIRVSVDEAAVLSPEPDASMVALDDALEALARIAPRQAKVVELRYFGGLSVEQTIEVMGISERTVMRDWEFAKAWLSRELSR